MANKPNRHAGHPWGRRALISAAVGGTGSLAGCASREPEHSDEGDQDAGLAEDDGPTGNRSNLDDPEPEPEREPPVERSDTANYIFTTEAELSRVRALANAGQEPWASAKAALLPDAEDAVTAALITYDSAEERGNAPLARKLIRNAALGFYFTGEDRFAEATIDKLLHFLLNEGTSYEPTDPVIPHARIINSIVIPGLLFAASLVREHHHWDSHGGTGQIEDWCRTYLETCQSYTVETYGDERRLYKHPQNRYEYRILDRLANAAYIDDDDFFDDTITLWKEFHNAKVSFPDAGANLAVYPSGRRNDAGRDEGWEYARYGLDASVSCAEVARQQGYDLYTWQDTPEASDIVNEQYVGELAGPLIPRQFRWLNRVFRDPSTWDGGRDASQPPDIEPMARGVTAYEYGASRFHGHQLGAAIADVRDTYFDRPAFNRKNTGHVTLTHGNRYDLGSGPE